MGSVRRRKFSEEEKNAILEEASARSISVVLREHKLSYSVFSRWKEQLHASGKKEQKSNYKILQELKDLVTENERLKKIIANQALQIQIQTEKLKNRHAV
ncbi:MAG TPA: transposase [Parafilimonas sp.]|nr:transposase [Parafilimonas sp.]